MLIIPAVDIKGGRCVRLLQGRKDSETVFSDDPSSMASRWEAEGAELLHVVDLDGAFEKGPQNVAAIKGIVDEVRIPVQLGGGIRTMDTISMYLDLGIARVIVGTEAIRNPGLVEEASQRYPGRIVVGIDARDGMVAVEGWTETTKQEAIEVAKGFEACALAALVFTDIHRDGMQTGPSIGQTKRLAESVNIPVIASGGVSNIDDIKALLPLEDVGVQGVITGRALYSGTLDLRQALEMGRKGGGEPPG
ncbi:MAG: 1-(5-phosphoribosyl)-5-[(5-phosphoribosylamino)methylideneamino]imidazole-4-carboxamide isomerase [Thermodesulfobacteriota bacterium]|nr:1-(5-phosphoribosyl)-5-[(5-phosphoribosylamino)methylideneamino]imidazole-4-carboxamide isomerase [Thermodesulfobacteriota bacterium]